MGREWRGGRKEEGRDGMGWEGKEREGRGREPPCMDPRYAPDQHHQTNRMNEQQLGIWLCPWFGIASCRLIMWTILPLLHLNGYC